MPNIKHWIQALRLRTLPLALSSIIVGGCLAFFDGKFNFLVTLLAVITTTFLQILSNLANDYGDFKSGADNKNRIGPERTLQGGKISSSAMIKGIIITSILSLVFGIWLIYEGTKSLSFSFGILFFVIGLGAMAAAIKYTVGKKAYGYFGLGDFFVFIFFGLTGVLGTYFLNTHFLRIEILLPAISIGFLSAGVLNLNNMRDRENDKISGKNTLVVKFGIKTAKYYHAFLILGALVSAVVFMLLNYNSPFQFLFLITIPILFYDLNKVLKNTEPVKLDPFLKRLALTTLLFSITFGIGLII
ncbi:MAG: 1,4-dihydroxy-2-naphthoate polyprenyltransferase [Bacteroidales bacterium]|nr:1,4-dihydroxy-2-naphthoate polyprenyltransferase [Bacteroidales bacterium]